MFPEDRGNIHCVDCGLYPKVCNVHKIQYKRNKIPMVWQLQTAVYHGERSKSIKLIKQIKKEVEKNGN